MQVYDPSLYDVVTPSSINGDMEWYCAKAVESGGPVLELGAGSGRITIPVARKGITIHALDLDEGMISTLQSKVSELDGAVQSLISIHLADMREFAIDERFAFAMLPYRAFLHNHTYKEQLACLRCIRRHLKPRGTLAFNVFHPSLEYMAKSAGPFVGVCRWMESHVLPDGRTVHRWEANRYDTIKRLVHSLHRFEVYGKGGTMERTFVHELTLSYLYPQDIKQLLGEAGFETLQISGDYTGRPVQKDDDELVIEAVRKD